LASLSAKVKKIFNRAWRRYGQPTATVVRPISEWNLPPGYSYNDDYDRIMDTDGYILTGELEYWVTDTVYIVPNDHSAALRTMIAVGAVPSGSTEFGILTTDLSKIENAHAIQIDGDWHDVVDMAHSPIGTSGTWALIRVKRRS
jgi:hypothetical protein